MTRKSVAKLQEVYEYKIRIELLLIEFKFLIILRNVIDIDLYAGGLLETIVGNDQSYAIGPTFGCIIMNQFANIKNSDRYYYENGPSVSPGAFNLNQLNSIRNITMAGLICNNYDIFFVQKMPFISQNAM
jgi:peroxidase